MVKWMDNLIEKWYRFVDKVSPFCRVVRRVFRAIGRTFRDLWRYVFWFRSIVLGAPLAGAAILIAMDSAKRLPETVSYTKLTLDPEAADALFDLFVMSQETVSRDIAVLVPLGLTAVCIVLMIFSKRMLYPFMIGLLTLTLPYIIYFFTVYPM